MADYKISLGAEVRTKDIDTAIKNYDGKVKIGVDASKITSDITSALNSYRASDIEVGSTLNTQGITDKIDSFNKKSNRKNIKVGIDKDHLFDGVETAIGSKTFDTPLRVKININWAGIKGQIANPTEEIGKLQLDAVLNKNAIGNAIKAFNKEINSAESKVKIKVKVNPDLKSFNSTINKHNTKPIKIAPQLKTSAIDEQIGKYNNRKNKRNIQLKAKLADGAVEEAIGKYVSKELVPVTVNFKVGSTELVDKKIADYKNVGVDVPVRLTPAKDGYDTKIKNKPIEVGVTIAKQDVQKDIEVALSGYTPTAKMPVNIKLAMPKDINKQVKDLGTPTEPIGIKPDLMLEHIEEQIRNYVPTERIKVNVQVNGGDFGSIGADSINGESQDIQTVRIARGVDDVTRAYRELLSIQSRMGNKQQAIAKLDTTKNQQEILELSRQIDELARKYQRIHQLFNGQFSHAQVDALNRNFEKTAEKLAIIKAKALDAKTSLDEMSMSSKNANSANNSNGIDASTSDVKSQTQAYKELMGVLNELNSKRLQLNSLDASSPQSSEKIQRLRLQIEQLDNEYNNLLHSFDTQGIQFTADQWNQIETAMAKVGRQIDVIQAGMSDKSVIQSQTQAYKELLSISKEIGSLEINIAKLRNSGGNDAQIEVLENQLRTLQSTYQQLVTTMNTPLTNDQWSSIYTQIARTSEALDKLQAEFSDTRAQMAQGITSNFGKYHSELLSLDNRFDALANKSGEFKAKIDSVRTALDSLEHANGIDDLISKNNEFIEVLNRVKIELTNLELAETGANYQERFAAEKEAAMKKLKSLFSEGSDAARKYGAEVEQLTSELNRCGNIKGVQNVTKKINALGTEIRKTSVQTQTLGERLKTQFAKYSSYFSVASLFMYAEQGLRSMFEQVKLIDSAMTELKKVTDETDASYNKFLKNAASRAKELGTTIDGLVASTADFARLGYGFEESQGLAEVANIYAVVGDEIEGVEDATQSLVSTMAAFKDEMGDMTDSEFALGIVDKMNEVSNNFAISSGGIGEALQRSASSMAAANNTIDETIAMITAANEVAQNPEKVGKWLCRLKKWLYRLNS